jgi:hypothetical protein
MRKLLVNKLLLQERKGRSWQKKVGPHYPTSLISQWFWYELQDMN